jgi:hypothetical protein
MMRDKKNQSLAASRDPLRTSFLVLHQIAILGGGLLSFIAISAWTYPIPLIIVFLPILMLFHPTMNATPGRVETCFLSMAIGFLPGGAMTGILWFIYTMGSADWR